VKQKITIQLAEYITVYQLIVSIHPCNRLLIAELLILGEFMLMHGNVKQNSINFYTPK